MPSPEHSPRTYLTELPDYDDVAAAALDYATQNEAFTPYHFVSFMAATCGLNASSGREEALADNLWAIIRDRCAADGVHLNITSDELGRLSVYSENDSATPEPQHFNDEVLADAVRQELSDFFAGREIVAFPELISFLRCQGIVEPHAAFIGLQQDGFLYGDAEDGITLHSAKTAEEELVRHEALTDEPTVSEPELGTEPKPTSPAPKSDLPAEPTTQSATSLNPLVRPAKKTTLPGTGSLQVVRGDLTAVGARPPKLPAHLRSTTKGREEHRPHNIVPELTHDHPFEQKDLQLAKSIFNRLIWHAALLNGVTIRELRGYAHRNGLDDVPIIFVVNRLVFRGLVHEQKAPYPPDSVYFLQEKDGQEFLRQLSLEHPLPRLKPVK